MIAMNYFPELAHRKRTLALIAKVKWIQLSKAIFSNRAFFFTMSCFMDSNQFIVSILWWGGKYIIQLFVQLKLCINKDRYLTFGQDSVNFQYSRRKDRL